MAKPVTPIVNLNGTSRESLVAGYVSAMEAIRKAQDALHAIHPHGRDYPGHDLTRFYAAMQQSRERMRALDTMLADIEAMAVEVNEGR